jgi:hypothetical protein
MMDVVTKKHEPPGSESGAGTARDAVDELIQGGLLDELMARVDEGSPQLTEPPTCMGCPGVRALA